MRLFQLRALVHVRSMDCLEISHDYVCNHWQRVQGAKEGVPSMEYENRAKLAMV